MRDLWWQWVNLVETVARDSEARARTPLAPDKYCRLHSALLKALHDHAEEADTGQKEFYLELASWVQPWLTVDALVQTDRQILGDLVRRCERAGEKMGRRPPRPLPWRWLIGLTFVLLVVFVATIADVGTVFVAPWSRELMRTWRRWVVMEQWLAAAAILGVFAYAFWPVRKP
jgi:hypothetical protein